MMVAIRYSHEQADMQVERIHAFLSQSYWARNIPFDIAEKSIANSVVIGAFDGDIQIGFARLVSDRATFAYLADVYVEEDYRRHGIAYAMVKQLQDLPEMQNIRHWALATRDAQPLYEKLGWETPPYPERQMQRVFNIYGTAAK